MDGLLVPPEPIAALIATGKEWQIRLTPHSATVRNFDDEERPLDGWTWEDERIVSLAETLDYAVLNALKEWS